MSSLCPFAKAGTAARGVCPMKSVDKNAGTCPVTGKNQEKNDIGVVCPVAGKNNDKESGAEESAEEPLPVPAKWPFGYDSNTLKLGPLCCMVCQALLHDASKCTPCTHKFCKACISCFKDCLLYSSGVEGIEPGADLQPIVYRFINGHAWIKRSLAGGDREAAEDKSKVIYEDVSMERSAFLVQQAMRLFAHRILKMQSRSSACVQKTTGRR